MIRGGGSPSGFLLGDTMLDRFPRRRALAACALLTLPLLAGAARADDQAPAAPAADASRGARIAALDQAIEHQKSRRSGAIAGMIAGGVIIVGGSVASAVASAQNQDDKNNGQDTRHNPYVGYAIGLGVGLPIMGISAWLFSDAQHELNLLKREKLSVTYAPDTHQPMLQLSFSY